MFDPCPCAAPAQLQKGEEAGPEILEFDRLKDHLEPYLRRGQAHVAATSIPAVGAASYQASTSSLLREVPAVAQRYGTLFGLNARPRVAGSKGAWDELEKYESLHSSSSLKNKNKGKKVDRAVEVLNLMRTMQDVEAVASLNKRWTSSWNQPLLAS